jgi:uncharacterized protein YyaL (SSP411 family)
MITAFARAHQVFGRPEDLASGRLAASFALTRLWVDGRLRATWRDGHAALNGYLDDYAFLGRSLLDLYETDFDRRWLDSSAEIATAMIEHFADHERGGFFFTSDDHERLLTRNRSTHDGALPAGAAVAAGWLARLGCHLDDERFRAAARDTLTGLRPAVDRSASAFATLLLAAEWGIRPDLEIAIVGAPEAPATAALAGRVRRRFLPRLTIAAGLGAGVRGLPLFEGRLGSNAQPTAYVCRDRTCQAPLTEPDALDAALDNLL